ncbi:hypothetical protein C8R48DRAFT_281490 [Suillus tomentosus]|nr:hypothetical protein C8R48DRAFT_281490 [Suillus tomentosus]
MHQDAQTVLENINGKLLRGRKLAVTFAYQAPFEPGGQGDALLTIVSTMKKWNSYSVKRVSFMFRRVPINLPLNCQYRY